MKIKLGRRLFKIRKMKLSFCVLPLGFPKLIHRLFRCVRSKFSIFKSRDRIPRPREQPKTRTVGRLFSCCSRTKVVPQGCVTICVGEEQQRYVIPIVYLYHPFIAKLLMEAENEFGYDYDHKGPLTVPCDIHDFEQLKWLIDTEKSRQLSHIHI